MKLKWEDDVHCEKDKGVSEKKGGKEGGPKEEVKKTKMKEKKKMERHTHGRKGINLIKAFEKIY